MSGLIHFPLAVVGASSCCFNSYCSPGYRQWFCQAFRQFVLHKVGFRSSCNCKCWKVCCDYVPPPLPPPPSCNGFTVTQIWTWQPSACTDNHAKLDIFTGNWAQICLKPHCIILYGIMASVNILFGMQCSELHFRHMRKLSGNEFFLCGSFVPSSVDFLRLHFG